MATGDKLVTLDGLKKVTDLYDGILFGAYSLPRTLTRLIINGSNKWASTNSNHVAFPCTEGDTVTITANASKATYFAWLASNVVVDGSAPSFATGETGRRTLAAGASDTFTAPAGTNYLYVHYDTTSSGTRSIFYPSSIKINGVEMNRRVSKEIGELQASVADILPYLQKKRYLKYISGSGSDASTERVEVYVPSRVGYIRYDFLHTEAVDRNADLWRVGYAYAVDDSFVERFALTVQGEWECALHLTGREDFSGGYAHGDEKLDVITFFVDGELVDITECATMTEFSTLHIVQTSQMLDPADGTTVIADHGSEHIFSDGLVVDQAVTWKADQTLAQCYMAMFPTAKAHTDKVFTDRDFVVKDADGTTITVPKATRAAIFSTTDGFRADISVGIYPSGIDASGDYFRLTDNGGNNYNKMYFAITSASGGATVSAGDVWMAQTVYQLRLAK